VPGHDKRIAQVETRTEQAMRSGAVDLLEKLFLRKQFLTSLFSHAEGGLAGP
jgi:FixJ family two-component response regulator